MSGNGTVVERARALLAMGEPRGGPLFEVNRECWLWAKEVLAAYELGRSEPVAVVTEEMVEAGARAICDEEWNGTQPAFDRKHASFGKRYRDYARAALTAALEAAKDPER